MKSNIQVKFVNSHLKVFVDGKEVEPNTDEYKGFELSDVGFSFNLDIEDNKDPVLDIKAEGNSNNFSEWMPYKGEGIFAIKDENQIPLAYEILKEHVGECEFDYCPQHFITKATSHGNKPMYSSLHNYGKFEIENLTELYKKMADNGIVIVHAEFKQADCC